MPGGACGGGDITPRRRTGTGRPPPTSFRTREASSYRQPHRATGPARRAGSSCRAGVAFAGRMPRHVPAHGRAGRERRWIARGALGSRRPKRSSARAVGRSGPRRGLGARPRDAGRGQFPCYRANSSCEGRAEPSSARTTAEVRTTGHAPRFPAAGRLAMPAPTIPRSDGAAAAERDSGCGWSASDYAGDLVSSSR